MASKIDYPELVAVIESMQDVLMKKALTYKQLERVANIVDGVTKAKKIGFMGEFGDIGMKSGTTCTYNQIDGTVTITEKEWDPQPYDTEVVLCSDDIEGTLGSTSLKNGVDRNDMTGTEYMDAFIDRFELALSKMYWRLAFMADTDAANVSDSPAGYITDGIDVKLLNVCDGLFKNLYTIIAANPSQRVTIEANDEATAALQNSELTPEIALTIANSIYFDAPLEIQTKMIDEGWVAFCTQSVFNKIIKNFKSFELESMKSNYESHLQAYNINGIPFVPVPEWDSMIQKFENNGTSYRDPHRIVCINPDDMLVGIPSFAEWGNYKVGFDERENEVWIKIKDKIDTNILHDNMVMVAI